MIEFALVAPLLFTVLFGAIDGGFFMYAKNTVDRASEVGMNSIAAAGVAPSADGDAIAAMRNAGLGSGALVQVTEIDVDEMAYSAGVYSLVSNCVNGASACSNPYDLMGNPLWTIPGGCTDTYKCQPWPPGQRSIHAATAAYVRLTIKYKYKFFAGPSQFSLSSSHIFRVEPKDV